jgi:iron-sulfur cluster insertion protein
MTNINDRNFAKKITVPPEIIISELALIQLKLILENDYTVTDKIPRISINGKVCEGFLYSFGLDKQHPDDFKVNLVDLNNKPLDIEVVLDPFCAYYLNNGIINFEQDFDTDREGFIVEHCSPDEFKGKFWKNSPEKILEK